MLKKRIKYNDLDGNEVEEDFYFNLTKAELVELELKYEDGLGDFLKRLIASENLKEIYAEFKNIVTIAYGQRSEDSKRFIKSKEASEAFVTSEPYSELLVEFLTVEGAAADFVNGIMPSGLDELATKLSVVPNPEETTNEPPEDKVVPSDTGI